MTTWTATVASTGSYELGEGPLWDPPRDRVLWVDVNAGTVHEGRTVDDKIIETGQERYDRTVGAVVCSTEGELLVAGAQTLIGPAGRGPRIVPDGTRRRLNDGACDPAGNFQVGSLNLDEPDGGECLVRVERDGSVTVLDDDLNLSNGLAWNADGTVLYSVDSVPGIVWTRSYDAATGAVGARKELLRITDGLPDGLCVDTEGHLWVAVWGAGQVRRFTPDGVLAGTVDVHAPHPTSVAFVGAGLDLLLITTATEKLTPSQLATYPASGRLFVARVGVTGLPVPAWSGPT